ncbi:hypothetical protein THAOC_18429, partial [Thalassiosira oceanica]
TDIDWDFRHNFPDAGWTGGDVIGKPPEIVDRVLELVIEVDAVRSGKKKPNKARLGYCGLRMKLRSGRGGRRGRGGARGVRGVRGGGARCGGGHAACPHPPCAGHAGGLPDGISGRGSAVEEEVARDGIGVTLGGYSSGTPPEIPEIPVPAPPEPPEIPRLANSSLPLLPEAVTSSKPSANDDDTVSIGDLPLLPEAVTSSNQSANDDDDTVSLGDLPLLPEAVTSSNPSAHDDDTVSLGEYRDYTQPEKLRQATRSLA